MHPWLAQIPSSEDEDSVGEVIRYTGATSYNLMYSGSHHNLFDKAVKTVDGKNYYSGTAAHWITNLAVDFCSKEQFVFADLLCFNYSIYGKIYLDNLRWFPATYCYDNEYDNKNERSILENKNWN